MKHDQGPGEGIPLRKDKAQEVPAGESQDLRAHPRAGGFEAHHMIPERACRPREPRPVA